MKRKKIYFTSLCFSLLLSSGSHSGPLIDLYQIAMEKDSLINQAKADLLAAQENTTQARSFLLPDINLSADLSERSPGDGSTGYALNLSQTLYNARLAAETAGIRLQTDIANIVYADQEQQLISRVINSYLDALLAFSMLENAKAQERAIAQRLDQVNAQFEVGIIAITDVQEAQASYDLALVQVIDAEVEMSNRLESILRITGGEKPQLFKLKENFPISRLNPDDPSHWESIAINNNPNIQRAQLQADIAEETVLSKKGSKKPVVSLGLTHRNNRPLGGNETREWSDDNTASVNLTMPIFTGGQINSEIRQAEQNRVSARFGLEDVQREVLENLRSTFRTIQNSQQSVAAREQLVTSRQTALNSIEEGLRVGTRNIVDLVDAEQNLFEAITNLEAAKINHLRSLVQFKHLLGQLSRRDLENLDNWLDTAQVAETQ